MLHLPTGGVASLGSEAVDLARTAGLVLDEWQVDILTEALTVRLDGRWSAFEVVQVMPRQNGKNAVLEARQLTGLFLLREPLAVHSAHEFKTTWEHFLRIEALIEETRELSREVDIIRRGSANVAIELKNGARLKFIARSRQSGRGLSGDTVYLDEAFSLTADMMGALLPTLSAVPNPQVWYASSAPHFTSDFLHSVLKRADENGDSRLLAAAWENSPETVLSDIDAWYRVNPALGIRITEEYVGDEMRTLCASPEGVAEFKRERLGIREGGDGEAGVVPYTRWTELAIGAPPSIGSVSYGLAVAADGSWSSVASAGRLPSGDLYVDNVRFDTGTAWVQSYIADDLYPRKRLPIRIDPSDSAGAFIRPLKEAGVEVVEVAGREYQQACGELLAAVEGGRIRHLGQASLNKAVAAAGRRDVGKEGGWVWVRPGAIDISPLKAASLALSGVELKRPPRVHTWRGPTPR